MQVEWGPLCKNASPVNLTWQTHKGPAEIWPVKNRILIRTEPFYPNMNAFRLLTDVCQMKLQENTLNVPSQPHKTLPLWGQKLLFQHKKNAFNTSFRFGKRATEIWKVVNLFYFTAAIFTCTSDNPITSPHYVCKHYFKFNLLVFTHSVLKQLYRKQWLINPSVQDRKLSSERKVSEMFNDNEKRIKCYMAAY